GGTDGKTATRLSDLDPHDTAAPVGGDHAAGRDGALLLRHEGRERPEAGIADRPRRRQRRACARRRGRRSRSAAQAGDDVDPDARRDGEKRPADARDVADRAERRALQADAHPRRLRRRDRDVPPGRSRLAVHPQRPQDVDRDRHVAAGCEGLNMRRMIVLLFAITVPLFAADPSQRIERDVVVHGSRAEVWKAWTTTSGAKTFFAPDANIELTPGGAYEIFFNWNAPTKFGPLRNERTYVMVRFDDAANGATRVRLTHFGWRAGRDWEE